jgi:hypothetical protein
LLSVLANIKTGDSMSGGMRGGMAGGMGGNMGGMGGGMGDRGGSTAGISVGSMSTRELQRALLSYPGTGVDSKGNITRVSFCAEDVKLDSNK